MFDILFRLDFDSLIYTVFVVFVVYTPVDRFVVDSLDLFDLQRVGGLKSHLQKEHDEAIKNSGILSLPSTSPLSEFAAWK